MNKIYLIIYILLTSCSNKTVEDDIISKLNRKYDIEFRNSFISQKENIKIIEYIDSISLDVQLIIDNSLEIRNILDEYNIKDFDQIKVIAYIWFESINGNYILLEDHLNSIRASQNSAIGKNEIW